MTTLHDVNAFGKRTREQLMASDSLPIDLKTLSHMRRSRASGNSLNDAVIDQS